MESNHIKVTLRDPDRYPEELKILLDIITINEVPKVVGSYAFTSHKYPSDVDVFERVTLSLGPKEAAVEYSKHFKNIAQKLLILNSEVYINDFKCGAYNGEPIRWTASQIIDGFLIINGKRITLIEALSQKEITKLDVIAYIAGKFLSVEVFYNLRFFEDGEEKDFYPLGSYVKSLLDDVVKYSSAQEYTPLKLAKRLWSLSRITDCSDLFVMLDPLMSSNAASLNQIKSDIEVLKDLLNNIQTTIVESKPLAAQVELYRTIKYNQNINRVHLEILQLYKRLSNHLNSTRVTGLSQLFDTIFNEWIYFSIHAVLNLPLVFKILDDIVKILKDEITTEAEGYLSQVLEVGNFCKINYNKYLNI